MNFFMKNILCWCLEFLKIQSGHTSIDENLNFIQEQPETNQKIIDK